MSRSIFLVYALILITAAVACTVPVPKAANQPIVITPVAFQTQTPLDASTGAVTEDPVEDPAETPADDPAEDPASTSVLPTATASPTPTTKPRRPGRCSWALPWSARVVTITNTIRLP